MTRCKRDYSSSAFGKRIQRLPSDTALKQAQNALIAWIQGRSDDQKKLAAWSTENAQQPLATGWEGKLSKHAVKLFGGYTVPAGQVPAGTSATDGNIIGGSLSYALTGYNLGYSQQQIQTQIAPIDARATLIKSRADYLQADTGFKERRRNAAHQKLVEKLAVVQSPNGPLNYGDRIRAIEERAANDLREAHARIRVISRGIQLVYGVPAPGVPPLPAGETEYPPSDLMERTIEWIREVGIVLQDIYNRDQDIVFRISLREILQGSNFSEGRDKGEWQFDFPSGYFKDFRLVRLKGLSANTKCESSIHYSILALPPRDVFMIYGPVWQGVTRRQHVDPCWVSRIFPEDSRRAPDVFGLRTLWNASPFGTWNLRAAPGASLSGLHDLLLNFHLTVQYI
jgi:hypothetical protein